jgi:hypothetical protein
MRVEAAAAAVLTFDRQKMQVLSASNGRPVKGRPVALYISLIWRRWWRRRRRRRDAAVCVSARVTSP